MAIFTMVYGKKERNRVLEDISSIPEKFMKDYGIVIFKTDKGFYITSMEISMRESGQMEKNLAKGLITFHLVTNMRGSLFKKGMGER